jgi:hypothetical protein
MFKELLDRVAELAMDAREPHELKIDDPRRKAYVLDGQVINLAIEPSPRDHGVNSLEDIVALAKRFHDESDNSPVVWYDSGGVVLVIDDDEHRLDQATLQLEVSDVFKTVKALRELKKWHTHRDFIRLLRIDLARTIEDGSLLNRIRKVKIENGEMTSSEVRKSKESLGRQITAEISGESEIPDEVVLLVPVYSTAGERARYPIACSVEADPTKTEPFRLMPLPDEIERVGQLATDSIAERLREQLPESVPCYAGTP